MKAESPLAFHHRSEIVLPVEPERLFAHLDDHRRLSGHMEKPSLMTAGASMRIDTDAGHGQAVGSVIRMSGRVLGVRLGLEEVVTEHAPPQRKVWETVGEPTLLVIGAYRMGFTIAPMGGGTRLIVFIDYRLPTQGIGWVLGLLLGRPYAAWCTRRMAGDARAAGGDGANAARRAGAELHLRRDGRRTAFDDLSPRGAVSATQGVRQSAGTVRRIASSGRGDGRCRPDDIRRR